ncbi:MAG: dTDP-glucose 4,6-dehydratase [Coleofasciculaceae cyanobacterium RL_1_1]|nr:dTDP-glucose 4,6-dehydratase [Coleofasciculaceae cyanobacterium RL_1_1]
MSNSNRPSRNILITGGAGFIGSNFTHHWCERYPNDRVVVLDALTYAGNAATLADLEIKPEFCLVEGNICDRGLVDTLLRDEAIDTVAHFAAESHVDRSILGPDAFVQTNVIGTFTLLEAFRHYYPTLTNAGKSGLFLHVSTDEVYGSLEPDDPAFSETTPYAPNSPYSASKASSDHFARAYFHTYGLPTIITNCSNNYGPYHFPEKLVPLVCLNILLGKPLPIYGDGLNVRDWLFVRDHCRALDTVIHTGKPGETYNVGGNNEVANIDLVKMLCALMDELAPNLPTRPSESLITYVQDRAGHDRRYAIDATKIKTELGWEPSVTVEEGLRQTVEWYLANESWWKPLLSADYQKYYDRVYQVAH